MRLFPLSAALPVLVLLAAALGSCQTPPDKRLLQYLNTEGFGKRYTGNAEEEDYVVLGDAVSYIDTINPELAGGDRVGLDGTITLPEIGAVHVAGMTRSEIEALLNQKFAPYFEDNEIRVTIATLDGKTYWVLGEVRTEGERPFPGDLTIFEAVHRARPNPSTANLGRVRLIRADPREPLIITVNVNDMIRTGDSTYNIHVREGDILYVPPTMLAQIGQFVVALISPVTTVFNSVAIQIINLSRVARGQLPLRVGRGRNNRNNNNFF